MGDIIIDKNESFDQVWFFSTLLKKMKKFIAGAENGLIEVSF